MVPLRLFPVKPRRVQTTEKRGLLCYRNLMQTPLAGLRFSVAGPGRVGSSLARWAVAAGAELVAVAGRHAGEPAWPDGPPRLALANLDTAGQDLLLIAVGDGAVAEVAARLASRPQARVVLHTSGSLDASALAPLRAAGIGDRLAAPLEGSPPAAPRSGRGEGGSSSPWTATPRRGSWPAGWPAAWGGVAAEVPAAARSLYHFAATLAAGGVVTLLAAAAEIAGGIGLPEQVTRGYLELARGALAAATRALDEGQPLAAAITGPVTRDDRETLRKHLAALGSLTPGKLPLAIFLLGEILHQTGREEGEALGAPGEHPS